MLCVLLGKQESLVRCFFFYYRLHVSPANSRPIVCSILGQRRRQWANIEHNWSIFFVLAWRTIFVINDSSSYLVNAPVFSGNSQSVCLEDCIPSAVSIM